MKLKSKYIVTIFLVWFVTGGYSQDKELKLLEHSKYYDTYTLSTLSNNIVSFTFREPATAISIKVRKGTILNDAFAVIKKDTFSLVIDPHYLNDSLDAASLIVPEAPIDNIKLYTGLISGKLLVHTFRVPEISNDIKTIQEVLPGNCQYPLTIDQTSWRDGLPPPVVPPTVNTVNHVIIHHSAGSNANTDGREAVRNIYIYHTSAPPAGNGWDDIGYNFLIARDGTVYEGRDGQGMYPDDNVKGAHFCSKNAGTMGICLLGTYNTERPTDTMLFSLAELISWKMKLESLDPLGASPHPDSTSANLPAIAGHRDGCSTECPGNVTYGILDSIRNSVNTIMADCPEVSGIPDLNFSSAIQITVNEKEGIVRIKRGPSCSNFEGKLWIYDINGRVLSINSLPKDQMVSNTNVSELPEGLYIYTLTTGSYKLTRKLLLLH